MMRSIVAVLCVLTIVSLQVQGAVTPYEGLDTVFQRFMQYISKDQIMSITLNCMANDEEVGEAFEYTQTPEFQNTILEVEAIPEFKQFLKYLQDHGCNIYKYIDMLHEAIGLPHFEPKLRDKGCGGMRGYVDAIEDTLPIDKLKKQYEIEMQNSDVFKSFIETLSSRDFQELVKLLKQNDGIKIIIDKLEEHNISLKKLCELLGKILEWEISLC